MIDNTNILLKTDDVNNNTSLNNNILINFKKYLDDFLPRENTKKQYFSQVNKFLKEHSYFQEFDDDDLLLRKIIGFINDNPRIYHRTYSLKLFLKFLNKDILCRKLPQPLIVPRKILNKSLPFKTIKSLVNNTNIPLRQRLIPMFQYDTTCRIGAILKIKKTDIMVDETTGKIKVVIIEKRGIVRTVYLSDETVTILNEYLKTITFKNPDDKLIQSEKWENIYLEIWTEQKKCLKEICENTSISTHWFRHSRIIHLLEKDYSILEVQRLTGHKDLNSLKKYLEIAGIQSRELMEKEKPKW